MSSNSDVDHPICEECTDSIFNQLDDSINQTQYQTALYKELFESNKFSATDDIESLEKELHAVRYCYFYYICIIQFHPVSL